MLYFQHIFSIKSNLVGSITCHILIVINMYENYYFHTCYRRKNNCDSFISYKYNLFV